MLFISPMQHFAKFFGKQIIIIIINTKIFESGIATNAINKSYDNLEEYTLT